MCKNRNSRCEVGDCPLQCYELITKWIKESEDESTQAVKAYADIIRKSFNIEMLKTLCKRVTYKGVCTFADWCYMSGSLVSIERTTNGYFKVKLPRCMFDTFWQAWSSFVREFYYSNSNNYDDTSAYDRIITDDTVTRKSIKSRCPYAPDDDDVAYYSSSGDFMDIPVNIDVTRKANRLAIEDVLRKQVCNGT